MPSMACFQCGEYGHFAADCPYLAPVASDDGPGSFDAHMAVIDAAVADWQAGKLTAEQKRRKISDENRRYYGPGVRKALVWP